MNDTHPLIQELQWRGLLQDLTPGTSAMLGQSPQTVYVGFDPTADSLHIGNLIPIMLLLHMQRNGHHPIALLGGATGLVGDPSGRTTERPLLSVEEIDHNAKCIGKQLSRFLDFDPACGNPARLLNNHDWFRNITFLDFIRDAGKHIPVAYMLSKDSVKSRMETGISFTEFCYQLIQGYDYLHLYRHYGCRLQMGGSDQWGNIITGAEMIRRMDQGEAHALTAPLVTRSDGNKFGKSEGKNVWLDAGRTSAYQFYQFWLNVADDDARRLVATYTLRDREYIEQLKADHDQASHERRMQRLLAEDLTTRVHGVDVLAQVQDASAILFGRDTADALRRLQPALLLDIMEGVPRYVVPRTSIEAGRSLLALLVDDSPIFPSRGQAREMIEAGGVSLNKQKSVDENQIVTTENLLCGHFILVQKGKKNYYLIEIV
ncbi:MAG: tyrosine--tRNA ligase [Sphingomonadales bacterium]|nr:tyrosine--tRNA ligase [Sphingomonadales bacterium]